MKTLQFCYDLKIEFTEPVTHHSFTVKCTAQTDERQQILQQDIAILPKEFLSENHDSFGNCYIFGRTEGEHDLFRVTNRGTVRTGLCDSVAAEEPYRQGMYLMQTSYTKPGEGLREFYGTIDFNRCSGNLEKARLVMEEMRKRFAYETGSTGIMTTAEEAWQQGKGVCQDYAHICLALLRQASVPCRYVVGMLTGEGLSHAWIEIADGGRWYGLDPTNGIPVLEEHIKISHGRDYADCLINQGVFTGSASQIQSITVSVREA